MSLEYNKKQRVHKTGSSPRDLQNRLNNKSSKSLGQPSNTIMDLMMQVAFLTTEVKNLKLEGTNTSPATVISNDKKYTEDEFNSELTKALKKELANIELKLEAKDDKIYALELKTEALTDIKERLATELACIVDKTVVPPRPSKEVVKIGKRPSIEDAVIDPTNSDKKLESYINIKEVKSKAKIDMKNKVNKLKELLGGN